MFTAAAVGSAGIVLTDPARSEAAVGGALLLGQTTNDAVANETWLSSAPGGDKATFVVRNTNATIPSAGSTLPDGMRVFAAGGGTGAAIQGFGGPNTFSSLHSPTEGGVGVRGVGARIGIQGRGVDPSGAIGVQGETTVGWGVYGKAPTGVKGDGQGSGSTGVEGTGEAFGVTGGTGATGAGTGVFGGAGTGIGVHGLASSLGGVGVRAEIDTPTDGNALEVVGPVTFSSAGLVTLASGHVTVTVTPGIPITTRSKVIATLQSPGGTLTYVARNATNNAFVIHLAAAATQNVIIAWFVIS